MSDLDAVECSVCHGPIISAVIVEDGKARHPGCVPNKRARSPGSSDRDKPVFRCFLCGHRFVPGDVVRWQFTNDIPGAAGNPLVCKACDGTKDEVVAKWKAMHAEANGRMWWFCRDLSFLPHTPGE